MFSRRAVLVSGSAMLASCALPPMTGSSGQRRFVSRQGTGFRIAGRPYHFAGANMWHAAYLGADAPYGNRDRLRRELDSLATLGIDNLRILGSSELSPLKGSMSPAFRTAGTDYNRTLLEGLDFALAEMGRRNIHAVVYLTNFWEWSGGMMTYLYWTNGGKYIDMNDPAHPWPAFADAASAFYANDRAVGLYNNYVRALVTRTNSVTGTRYADDPVIMSWQLANEPRPGGGEAVAQRNMPAYLAWIANSARLIKSLDPNHLVSTGSEGLMGCVGSDECVIAAHQPPEIDYLTAHIWPQNWGWVDPADLAGTWAEGEAKVREYIARHIALANRLGKPLVIEEFGFPRDTGSFDPSTTTHFRDRFYGLVHKAVIDSARSGGPLAGSNFWAWNGKGRAQHADHRFRPGDTQYLGDPPHEPQGWYGVFDSDRTTRAEIRAHASALATIRA